MPFQNPIASGNQIIRELVITDGVYRIELDPASGDFVPTQPVINFALSGLHIGRLRTDNANPGTFYMEYQPAAWSPGVTSRAHVAIYDGNPTITLLVDDSGSGGDEASLIMWGEGNGGFPQVGNQHGGNTFTSRQPTLGSTTSTSYTATLTGVGAAACSHSFIAPKSGQIMVFHSAELQNNTAGQFAKASFEVRQGSTIGSGTVVYAANDDDAIVTDNTDITSARFTLVPGLTGGSAYNIREMFKSTSGASTAFFKSKELIIQPQL